MRIGIAICCLLLLMGWTSPSQARFGDISIATEWVVDSNVGGGGYVRVEVVNNGTTPAFIVAVGDNSDVNVTYTAPPIAGQWWSFVIPKGDWQANDPGFVNYPWMTLPDTATELPWEDYFPTEFQCIAWQAKEESFGIQPGDPTPTEFRYLVGEGAKRALYGPLSYLVIGIDGELLGAGETSITGVVETEGASFGRVKSLFTP